MMQDCGYQPSFPAMEAPDCVPQDDIDRRFHILETIGEGTYGVVYKALDYTTN